MSAAPFTTAQQDRLVAQLVAASGATAGTLLAMQSLSGGAIQENWLLQLQFEGGRLAGSGDYVLRTDAPSGVSTSHGRAQEFALLRQAHAAGVTVPEPLWLCTDLAVLGRPFFVMRKVAGTAAPHRLMKEPGLAQDRRGLTRRLGQELARIHSLRPGAATLAFLGDAPASAALAAIERMRLHLAALPQPRPVLQWTLGWLTEHADRLPAQPVTLCHRDFRTGNYMVDAAGLTGVLDWEFAGWSDPLEDIGWLCAKCWRFGSPHEVGGVGDRDDLYAGYREAGGPATLTPEGVHWWEVYAHLNWATIALQQYQRHRSGCERSLLLALTGYRVPELELEILQMTGAA